MEHIYQNASFGENWFGYERLYSHYIASVPENGTIVEVGSWKGKSVAYLAVEALNSYKNIKIYAVDTWKGSGTVHNSDPHVQSDTLYELFLHNVAPIGNVEPIRLPSVEAAALFADNSIDAVFIDADHEYDSVKADIAAWLPKVKKGGLIGGHDYDGGPASGHPGVRDAVHESFGRENIITYPACCWLTTK